MFQPVPGNVNFPEQELAVGRFWKEHRIYQKSLAQRAGAPPFVFYEGPPTANGMPHPGHCLTRAIKDLFPRYKTMRGYRCERKAGWDTHGLPVEVEVSKELGIHSKEEIEAYGVEPFIQKCQQSVWRYMQEWERLTERIGFWVDLEKAYVTYHQSYVESVWWSLKNLFDSGLLYQGHKIVWWWAQGGTALSAGEVGQGYRQVADPSVYVKFPLLDDAGNVTDTSLLVWTTTPWTLPSNQFAAVNPEVEYDLIVDPSDQSRFLIVASVLSSEIVRKWTHRAGSIKAGTSIKAGGSISAGGSIEAGTSIEAGGSIRAGEIPSSSAMIVRKVSGKELFGRRYLPPFDSYYSSQGNATGNLQKGGDAPIAWRVVAADFVTTDSGTGVVHQAPAFGEVDFEVLIEEQKRFAAGDGPKLINAVAPDGKFTDEAPEFCRGRWVKDCDKDIIRDLKQRGLLYHQEQYLHEYPFCWRAEQDPLIQYPRESWFIRTTEYKDAMLANNDKINWLPEHIKTGRFGKFLESNVDWALSRERYWGTPLPIWVCDKTGQKEAIASYDELLAKPGIEGTEVWAAAKKKSPELPDDLRVHKPYIDAVTYDSPFAQGGRMNRVPDVIDAWYDSGSMPFAQWGYPHAPESKERFESQFPADFISEAIDQTRGWFYSQLAISTMLFGEERGAKAEERGSRIEDRGQDNQSALLAARPYPHPFRNCIVLGLMLGEDGQKMSKSKRNYREPNEIVDKYGADALRWYFFANQPPWTAIRYSEQAIKDSVPEFLLRLWNVYSFFVIYANIDGFDPAKERGVGSEDRAAGSKDLDSALLSQAKSYRPIKDRSELDRWILGELNQTCKTVDRLLIIYDNYGAAQCISEFVDALSNWYVRRSRDRFWAANKRSTEKLDAYWTLYECLLTTSKLIAPFVPFIAETIWQNLARSAYREQAAESVHLCDYPHRGVGPSVPIEIADLVEHDEVELSQRMNLVRLISSLGRSARTSAALKVRQPLSKVEVILADTTHQVWLEEHAGVILEELNVKKLEFCDDPALYVDYEVNPNFKLLGPKLGKLLPKVKAWLGKQSGAELLANIRDNGLIDLEIDGEQLALTREEVEVRIKPKPGWASANDRGVVVVLSTELTPELVEEGIANDVVRLIQDRRKDSGCEYTDRIEIGLVTESAALRRAVERFRQHIMAETLAVKLDFEGLDGVEKSDAKIVDDGVSLYVRVAS